MFLNVMALNYVSQQHFPLSALLCCCLCLFLVKPGQSSDIGQCTHMQEGYKEFLALMAPTPVCHSSVAHAHTLPLHTFWTLK